MAETGTDQHLLRIKPFNGSEFATWESNLKLILEQHSVLDVITDSPQNPNTDAAKTAEFTQNDIKARFIITQAVADHMQIFIKDQKTAKGMLESLQRDFGSDAIVEKCEPNTIHMWTDDETKRLLNFYHQMLPDLQAGRIVTKEKMLAAIAKKLGGQLTATQCSNRIKSLQRSFRVYKNGRSSFRPKFADLIEAIDNGSGIENSAAWLDLSLDTDSMDIIECDTNGANASKQIYESTTLIPHNWSDEDTMRLLDLYNQLKPELVVGSISSQEKVMEIIAQEMGGHLTPMQCLNKFKNLRASYKNYKKDPVAKKFKYAASMEAIEGGDPDHTMSEEVSSETQEIVIVGSNGEVLSEGESNEGETDAAITFITRDADDAQDEHQSEEEATTDNRMAWSYTNTVKLLGLVENIASQVGTPQVRSRARMWTLIARRMGKTVTGDQCACRWRTLERSYKKSLEQGRGHPYSAQMKTALKRLNGGLLPMSTKLVTKKNPESGSDDVTFFLGNYDQTMDDSTSDQDATSSFPRVSGIYSLISNETDEAEGDAGMWSHENTLKLIELYKHLKCLVGSFKIRTHKKMWQVIAERMGGNLTPSKCENRWRVLERKYRKHLSISTTLGLKGRSIKAFEYFPQMDALLNWSTDNPTAPPAEVNYEFAGVHLSSNTMSAPPVDILSSSSFDTSSAKRTAPPEEVEDDLDITKEKIPYELKILERMRRDKKAYYTQMVLIHKERLEIEQQRLEELKRKNRILERNMCTSKRPRFDES